MFPNRNIIDIIASVLDDGEYDIAIYTKDKHLFIGVKRPHSLMQYYDNDEKVGQWNYWDNDGKQSAQGDFKNNKKDGIWIYWHGYNNIVSSKGEYRNDLKVGTWVYWYDNGYKKEEVDFKNGSQVSSLCWDRLGKEIDCR